jgi:LysR family transcriptional regulator, hca operon transcriptional activator
MGLRHLRYFVAVGEAGVAAKLRLHAAQPSLSRQIRELESEVGAQLLTQHARGIQLTAAGRAFLDHARIALAHAEHFLPGSIISRPLAGDAPTIDLVVGYSKTNASQTLQLFLSRVDELIARSGQKSPRSQNVR